MQVNRNSTNNFKYLLPPLDAFQIKHTSEYIKHGKKKKIIRKIFHFVDYDEYENAKIKELTTKITEEKINLPKNWLESDTLKYCYAGKFKMPNCIKQLKKHLDWMHNDKMQNLSDESLEILKRGIIYTYGRDRFYRPIVVFDVHKINFKKDKLEAVLGAFSHLLTTVYDNMFVPGIIENWIIIIDINNMSLMNVPFKILSQVIDCMSNNYVSTVERLFITNPSSSLFLMWKIIEAMMDPETVQKIRFIKKANFHEMQEFASEDQIQKKYGGKLEDLKEFWPPISLIDVRKDTDLIDSKVKALKERIFVGCQTTNCLPEKKIKIELEKHREIGEMEEPKITKYEPKLNSPKLSDLVVQDSPKLLHNDNDKIEETNQLNNNNYIHNNINNKSINSLSDTNSTLSLRNEVLSETFTNSNEIMVTKNNAHQNIIKNKNYEIISEKNENEEKEIEGEAVDFEGDTVNMPKKPDLVFEREEKNVKCQPCKECVIF